MYALGSSMLHKLHYNEHRVAAEENLKKDLADRDYRPTYFLFDHDPVGENGTSREYPLLLVLWNWER